MLGSRSQSGAVSISSQLLSGNTSNLHRICGTCVYSVYYVLQDETSERLFEVSLLTEGLKALMSIEYADTLSDALLAEHESLCRLANIKFVVIIFVETICCLLLVALFVVQIVCRHCSDKNCRRTEIAESRTCQGSRKNSTCSSSCRRSKNSFC